MKSLLSNLSGDEVIAAIAFANNNSYDKTNPFYIKPAFDFQKDQVPYGIASTYFFDESGKVYDMEIQTGSPVTGSIPATEIGYDFKEEFQWLLNNATALNINTTNQYLPE